MKTPATRILGMIAIVASPWTFIDFVNNGLYDRFVLTSASGIRSLIFMTGWICSMVGLYKLEAMGNKQWQRRIMIVQIVLLCLAGAWCIIEIIAPSSPSKLFYLLNFSWPLAGICMMIIGIVILLVKRLKGWRRYIPLLAALWFPQTMLIYLIGGNSITLLLLSGIYSVIAFSLLGFVLLTENELTTMQPVYRP
jgi:hypothetical protein